MKQRLKAFTVNLLRRILHWLEPCIAEHPLEPRVTELMTQRDRFDMGGEAKRHQVLSALLKEGVKESEAALVIELVTQARQGKRWVLVP